MFRIATLLLGITLVGLALTAARADIPLPSNLEYIKPTVQFVGVDKLPEYVFQLRVFSFAGSPSGAMHKYTPVKDDKPFTLNVERRLGSVELLAMQRDEFAKRAKADPSLKWLTAETAGVLSAELDPPSTVGDKKRKTASITKYTVELKEGKLVVTTEAPPEDPSKNNPPGMLWWINTTLAAILSLALIGFGLYFARPARGKVELATGM
ncbi:hypothetical protein ETAA8_07940 [Anatilimnocola aggregata]|uniref:Uncharacterized protein n=1 Tax=Anatilimnocola aggregata TaxID=2528021 RepID=A0A517Y662_9BACT|nr:hypothetical protein [Anatilimnocola aggregata]QDU25724.1 hypothetical protein ETAA8_07940 [Anatilimnocola aggregata]